MKYIDHPKVNQEIRQKGQRDIEAVNAYLDGLKGTVVTLEYKRSGQPRPYADSVDEVIIFCHQPNCLTTNAPLLRCITRDEAKALARVMLGGFEDAPKFLHRHMESLDPIPNPVGMEESKWQLEEERHSCWRIVLRSPFND